MSDNTIVKTFLRMNKGRHLIFFDGHCGLCDRSVQRVFKHDRAQVFCFASLQSQLADELRAPYGIERGELTTLIVIAFLGTERERISRRSKAVRFICFQLPPYRWAGYVLAIFPSFIADLGYRLVASLRHRFFGKVTHCMRPNSCDLDRFFIH